MSSTDDTVGARLDRDAFDIVVVGASIAGVRAVETLRQQGYAGSVLLVGDEPELPYDRPPLSKQFLVGDWDHDRVRLLTAAQAAELDVHLALGRAAIALDTAAHTVTLADGTRLRYGVLVIATGAAARWGPWAPSERVHALRSRADSTRLQPALRPGRHVVVVGAGYIGAEVAAAAHRRGCRVSVVDVVANPYLRSLGADLGAVLGSIHDRHGAASHLGVGVAGIRDEGPVAVVELADGRVLEADAVVVGIGAAPNTGWLDGSGVPVDDGVLCDEFGRVLGVPDVLAAGDVARWGARRHEHWTSAVEQARAVAHNVVGPADPVPSAGDGYVWSDQYDWKIQLVGATGGDAAGEIVGSPDGTRPRLAALYCDADGRLVGAASVNWPKALMLGRRSIGTTDVPALAAELRRHLDAVAPVPAVTV